MDSKSPISVQHIVKYSSKNILVLYVIIIFYVNLHLEKTFLSCETCVLSKRLLDNKICLKYVNLHGNPAFS
jgi:hypothetical protein